MIQYREKSFNGSHKALRFVTTRSARLQNGSNTLSRWREALPPRSARDRTIQNNFESSPNYPTK